MDRRQVLIGGGAAMVPQLARAATQPIGRAGPDRGGFDVHRFGVNYVPPRKWYFFWNDFTPADTARDFDAIAALGADHIRLMVVWPWFHPNTTYVSTAHLDRLDVVMALAAERGLDVMPSVFTGWLSGYAFIPPFDSPVTPQQPGLNFYTSPKWRAAQMLYLTKLAERLVKHRNFIGFDFGNEMDVCWPAETKDGDPWMAAIFAKMKALAPHHVHVNGLDHNPYFENTTFSPQALVEQHRTVVPIHAYPFWTGAKRYAGPLERPYTAMPAAMALLIRSYAGDLKRPVWLQEFGACRFEMPADDVPRWARLAMEQALAQGVSWLTWWGSHDVDRTFDFYQFEYDLGLLDVNGRIKPAGHVFREIAQTYRGKAVVMPTAPLAPPPATRTIDTAWQWMLAFPAIAG